MEGGGGERFSRNDRRPLRSRTRTGMKDQRDRRKKYLVYMKYGRHLPTKRLAPERAAPRRSEHACARYAAAANARRSSAATRTPCARAPGRPTGWVPDRRRTTSHHRIIRLAFVAFVRAVFFSCVCFIRATTHPPPSGARATLVAGTPARARSRSTTTTTNTITTTTTTLLLLLLLPPPSPRPVYPLRTPVVL